MQRERLTITMVPELLPALDQLVDHSTIRNRSHAIEHVLRQGLALNELHLVFLLVTALPEQPLLQAIASLGSHFGITGFRLIAPTADMATATTFGSSLRQAGVPDTVSIDYLPGDFGSGAALLLHREEITSTFLIIDLGQAKATSLVAAYTFHRQQQGTVTHLVYPDPQGHFTPAGYTFAEPSLLAHIPAGMADLTTTVFPRLQKGAKVSAYVLAE